MSDDRLTTGMQLAELVEAARDAIKTQRRNRTMWSPTDLKWLMLAEDEVNFAQEALSKLSVWSPTLF